MTLLQVARILEAHIHCGQNNLDAEIEHICAGDLMSDLLAFSQPHALLITGLVNVQVIRTAEMLDLSAIVFIRGKKPTGEMVELANEKNIPLLTTEKPMYQCCGKLFEAGLKA